MPPELQDVFPSDNSLIKLVNDYWKGSKLENMGKLLFDECSRSTVPYICMKVIAIQVHYETGKGTTGTGLYKKNLTGIRDSGTWRVYNTYEESIVDTVKVFVDGDYQDYYTIYGFNSGLCKHLERWGTNHCSEIKNDLDINFI